VLLAATYLIMPPAEEAGTRFRINFSAPPSGWVELRRFNSASECAAAIDTYRHRPAGGLPAMLGSKQQAIAAMGGCQMYFNQQPPFERKLGCEHEDSG
jgi:hypothetical protein